MSDVDDAQFSAEQLDEEVTGLDDPVTSDEVRPDYPADHYEGVPFADADVSDESFADRSGQEQPEQLPDDRHIFPWEGQLPAHCQRQGTTNHQHDQRGDQKLDSDDLVIQREHVLLDKCLLMMPMRMIICVAMSI